jgi:hypothetical protein
LKNLKSNITSHGLSVHAIFEVEYKIATRKITPTYKTTKYNFSSERGKRKNEES